MSYAEGTGTFSERHDFFLLSAVADTIIATQRSLRCSGLRFYALGHFIHSLTFLLRDCCRENPNTTLFRGFFFSALVGVPGISHTFCIYSIVSR